MNKTQRKAKIIKLLDDILDRESGKGNLKLTLDAIKELSKIEGLENSNFDNTVILDLSQMPAVTVTAMGFNKETKK